MRAGLVGLAIVLGGCAAGASDAAAPVAPVAPVAVESPAIRGACVAHPSMQLGIPDGTVFFLGEVSVGLEPEANRRWALLGDGRVMFSANTVPSEVSSEVSSEAPFNAAFGDEPIARLDAAAQKQVGQLLDDVKFWSSPATVPAPPGLVVRDGSDVYVLAVGDSGAACVRYRPGATTVRSLSRRFKALVVTFKTGTSPRP